MSLEWKSFNSIESTMRMSEITDYKSRITKPAMCERVREYLTLQISVGIAVKTSARFARKRRRLG